MAISYLTQTAQLLSQSGHNSDGEPTFSASADVKCRIQHRKKVLRATNGDLIVSLSQVFLPPDLIVKPGDRLTIGGRNWSVLEVEDYQGPRILSHKVAFCGG